MVCRQGKPTVYVSAFFCEKSLTDKDGVLSAFRLTEQYFVPLLQLHGKNDQDQDTVYNIWQPITLTLIITFRSEEETAFKFHLESVNESGERESMEAREISLHGGVRGQNLKIDLHLGPKAHGSVWFELFIDNEMVTRLPLEVIRQALGPREQQKMLTPIEGRGTETDS